MISILIIAKNDNNIQKYYVDELGRFLSQSKNKKSEIILENISNKLDMVYTNDDIMHFVLQDKNGSLIYLKYQNNIWKKYEIFNCIHKSERIYDLKLCVIHSILCAFYILETNSEKILVKHIFTSSDFNKVPEVLDRCDKNFDLSLCTLKNDETHLFYKNINGEIIKKVFDRNFNFIREESPCFDGEISKLQTISISNDIYMLFIEQKKSYNVLKFKFGKTEKVICFALSKNTEFGMILNSDEINIRWIDNFNLYEVKSTDSGKTFTKPIIKNYRYYICYLREKGVFKGMYCDKFIFTLKDNFTKPKDNVHINNIEVKENENMNEYKRYNFSSNDNFTDISKDKYIKNLISIENEMKNLKKDTEKICKFLEKIIDFKNDTKMIKPIATQTYGEITDTNEENIKLFNEMEIDDVLPSDNL